MSTIATTRRHGRGLSRRTFSTIHHHNPLSHRNDLINASSSSTNERLLTCCSWLQCQSPGVGEKKKRVSNITCDYFSENVFNWWWQNEIKLNRRLLKCKKTKRRHRVRTGNITNKYERLKSLQQRVQQWRKKKLMKFWKPKWPLYRT